MANRGRGLGRVSAAAQPGILSPYHRHALLARYTGVAQPIGVPMPRPVVAAAIVDSLSEPTMLLACSRAYPQELRGQFELPGGKVEEGEDPTVALEREIAEELGARLTIGGACARRKGSGGRSWVDALWACGSLRLHRTRKSRAWVRRTLRPGGCPSRTSPCFRGLPLTCRLSRPWSPAAIADVCAVSHLTTHRGGVSE